MSLFSRRNFPFLIVFIGLLLISVTAVAATQDTDRPLVAPTSLLPIGAGYEADTLAAFAAQAAAYDSDNTVTIRVLPITYASNPFNISAGERNSNLSQAQTRADQIDGACQALISQVQSCNTAVVDVQIRGDANDPAKVAQINAAVDGIFIPGGDQTIAMQVVANTLIEDALETRFLAGVPFSGTSAGAAVQSRYMIGGYTGSNSAWNALELGAVDLWYGAVGSDHRGLRFGWQGGVLEQHVLERGRLARLLQATQQLPGPHLGLGVDWGTAAAVADEQTVTGVTGAFAAVVVDLDTYGAATNAAYVGPRQLLRLRNGVLHVIPPGNITYDLANRVPTVGAVTEGAPDVSGRGFAMLDVPASYGPLYITGDLATAPTGAVMTSFATDAIAVAGNGPTVVLATGYRNSSAANNAAGWWRQRLLSQGVPNVNTAVLTSNSDLAALEAQLVAAGAIFVVSENQERLTNHTSQLVILGLKGLWQGGRPLLLENGAAVLAGNWFSAMPTPTASNLEIQSSDTFKVGEVDIQPGLGLIPDAVFEPRLLYDYRYGRLVSHVHTHPTAVAFGLERATALKIEGDGATVLGNGVVLAVDGRFSGTLNAGNNGVIGATWLLLDTFVPGDSLPLGSATPTPTPTVTPTGTPPTPTATPPTPTAMPQTIHVGDLDDVSINPGGGWTATARIAVHDAAEAPIVGATVYATFSRGASGSGSCVTDSAGQCTVSLPGLSLNVLRTRFTVDAVTLAGGVYNPAANHDPDGDSNGAVITLYKP